ncbi:MAG: ribosome silencing factor [Chlamydiae bacterium]|nr:ribosome silencing factor [Chlamydiota bacterium]
MKISLDLVKIVAQAIYDKKGINILVLDVSGLSSITDYLIVAEGHVDRHVSAIASNVMQVLKELGERPVHAEGMVEGAWVAVDYLNFIVHLFGPGLRDYYAIERIWPQAKIVELDFLEQVTTA